MKIWRSRLGISQEELAERAGLHRTYISDIERGARNLSLESIEKLARALQIPLATLFRDMSDDGGQPGAGGAEHLVDILFIEDNTVDAELTMQALKEAKIANRVHLVRDGEEALGYLAHADRDTCGFPHLILLDLNLPKISGLDVLRRLKEDPRTTGIPVVVLTSSRHSTDISMSKALGASAYIVKPVGFKSLAEVTPQLCMQWALLRSVETSAP